jgi:hypothetical protein
MLKSELKAAIKEQLLKEAGDVSWGSSATSFIPGFAAGRIPGVGIVTGPMAQHYAENYDRKRHGHKETKDWFGLAAGTGLAESVGGMAGAATSMPKIQREVKAAMNAGGSEAETMARIAKAGKSALVPGLIGAAALGFPVHHYLRNHPGPAKE